MPVCKSTDPPRDRTTDFWYIYGTRNNLLFAILTIESGQTAPSDLTLFFLGSGFALFVALLGWSDQIRGLTRQTQELQRDVLKRYPLTRDDLAQLRAAKTADDRIVVLTHLLQAKKLVNPNTAKLVPLLESCDALLPRLDRLSEGKYRLTVTLTGVLFLAGASSLVSHQVEQWLLLSPSLLVVAIFIMIIVANGVEREFHNVLSDILELL